MATYWYDVAATTTAWTCWASTTATVTTTASTTWSYWIAPSATATSNTVIWSNWTAPTTSTMLVPHQPTPEQIAANEERMRVARARWEEQQARERADHEQAVERAETLLHSNLNPRQRRALKQHGRFRVRGSTGRWYEIGRGHHGITYELDRRGKRVNNLCVYATGGVPAADSMLAQKLHLETDEEHIRRVAHISRVYAGA